MSKSVAEELVNPYHWLHLLDLLDYSVVTLTVDVWAVAESQTVEATPVVQSSFPLPQIDGVAMGRRWRLKTEDQQE